MNFFFSGLRPTPRRYRRVGTVAQGRTKGKPAGRVLPTVSFPFEFLDFRVPEGGCRESCLVSVPTGIDVSYDPLHQRFQSVFCLFQIEVLLTLKSDEKSDVITFVDVNQ